LVVWLVVEALDVEGVYQVGEDAVGGVGQQGGEGGQVVQEGGVVGGGVALLGGDLGELFCEAGAVFFAADEPFADAAAVGQGGGAVVVGGLVQFLERAGVGLVELGELLAQVGGFLF
jgi:hypothetical protein